MIRFVCRCVVRQCQCTKFSLKICFCRSYHAISLSSMSFDSTESVRLSRYYVSKCDRNDEDCRTICGSVSYVIYLPCEWGMILIMRMQDRTKTLTHARINIQALRIETTKEEKKREKHSISHFWFRKVSSIS